MWYSSECNSYAKLFLNFAGVFIFSPETLFLQSFSHSPFETISDGFADSSVGGRKNLPSHPRAVLCRTLNRREKIRFCSSSGTDAMNSRMASSVTIAKASLRKELKTRLSNMLPEDRQRQSNIITQKVLDSDFYKSSSRVCIYLSMDEEVNTTNILKHLLEAGKTCFIPRYTKTEMEMLRLNSWQDFQTLPLTAWNIRQPPEKDNREEALSGGGLDLMVVPGLGFTADGNRLGRGKGYYDRYLAKCKTVSSTCVTLGLAFSQQILPDIPTGEDDMKLDFVLSEKD